MHFLCEVVMPPTQDVEEKVSEILTPFQSEVYQKEWDGYNPHAFFDYYQIGGRYSGEKLISRLGKDKVGKFCEELKSRGVTVSGVQFGKPTLSPSGQTEMVNRLWGEFFPSENGKSCPIFAKSELWGESILQDDVCKISEVPDEFRAEQVVIAREIEGGVFKIKGIYRTVAWNGVNFEKMLFDGRPKTAIAFYNEQRLYINNFVEPADDWLSVTVDCHH